MFVIVMFGIILLCFGLGAYGWFHNDTEEHQRILQDKNIKHHWWDYL